MAQAVKDAGASENPGKKTPGMDGELWDTPEKKAAGVERIQQWRGYRPVPLKRTYVPKHYLWRRLYRWTKRPHPNKTGRRIAQHYFSHEKGKAWWFTDPVIGQQLNPVQATVKTQRHVKIRGQANPFDPQWDGYFQQRDRQQAKKAFSGFRVNVLLRQQGLCPGCRQVIQVGEDLDLHHWDGNHQNTRSVTWCCYTLTATVRYIMHQ